MKKKGGSLEKNANCGGQKGDFRGGQEGPSGHGKWKLEREKNAKEGGRLGEIRKKSTVMKKKGVSGGLKDQKNWDPARIRGNDLPTITGKNSQKILERQEGVTIFFDYEH